MLASYTISADNLIAWVPGARERAGLSLSAGRPRRSSLGVLKGTVDVLHRSISLASPSAAPTLLSQYNYVSSTDVSMKWTFTEEYRSRGMSERLSACTYNVYQALFSPSPSHLEPRLTICMPVCDCPVLFLHMEKREHILILNLHVNHTAMHQIGNVMV